MERAKYADAYHSLSSSLAHRKWRMQICSAFKATFQKRFRIDFVGNCVFVGFIIVLPELRPTTEYPNEIEHLIYRQIIKIFTLFFCSCDIHFAVVFNLKKKICFAACVFSSLSLLLFSCLLQSCWLFFSQDSSVPIASNSRLWLVQKQLPLSWYSFDW